MAKARIKTGLKGMQAHSAEPRAGTGRAGGVLPLVAQVSLALAAVVAAYLLWHALTDSALGGCGPGTPCDRVLGSPWAYWLGLPVSALALAGYAVLFWASGRLRQTGVVAGEARAALVTVALALAILGAAGWFLALQVFVLKSLCKFCLTAHFFGSVGAASSLWFVARGVRSAPAAVTPRRTLAGWPLRLAGAGVVGLAAVGLLIGGQKFFPQQLHVVRVHDGQFKFDLREVPLLGSPDAPRAIVSLFDYTCPDCHDLHRHLMAAQARFTNRFAIVALPCPLDTKCNPAVTRTQKRHEQACDYARLGLAVRRVDRAAFEKYDAWIFGQGTMPTLDAARQFARELVGSAALDQAQRDPAVERLLQSGVALYRASGQRGGSLRLPQLILGRKTSSGPITRPEVLFGMIEEFLAAKEAW
ncbi:MAG: hypothetical protein HYY24_07630 [Verrucomicrobia bacterium]|nr:hypothetical protein [Verrucomicrobiota bacterium]